MTLDPNAGRLLAGAAKLAQEHHAWSLTAEWHDGVPAFEEGDRLTLDLGPWGTHPVVVSRVDLSRQHAVYDLEAPR